MKNESKQPEPVEPIWDAADPMASFLRYGEFLHQKARWMFLKDKTHVEMMFVFESGGECMLLLVRGDRDEFVANLRRFIKDNPVIGVVHICEAWTRFGGRGDHITKQIMLGEMGVSDLRPEDRGEALYVSVQSRDMHAMSWVDPIQRDARTGKVTLGECVKIDGIGGRFGRLFK